MGKILKPLIRGGGFYPNGRLTPLIYNGGFTTNDKGESYDPLNTFIGKIVKFFAMRSEPVVELEATLSPSQDLHGYDAPWPAGGGKNKGHFGDDNLVNHQRDVCEYKNSGAVVTSTGEYGRAGFSVAVQNGSTYTVSFKAKRVGAINNLQFASEASWNVNDYQSYTSNSFGEGSFTSLSFTFNATSDTLFVGFYVNTSGNSIILEDFQVELGPSATTFAPFSNECPISGHDGCTVYRTGKNLYGGTKSTDYTVIYGGKNNAATVVNEDYTFKAGTYRISFELDGYVSNPSVFFSSKVNGVWSSPTNRGQVTTFTFTVPENCEHFEIWGYGGNYTGFKNIQIEPGSSAASPYEPYTGTTYPITFPDAAGTVYGGTLVINEDGSGEIVANYAALKFNMLTSRACGIKSGATYAYIWVNAVTEFSNITDIEFDSNVKCSFLPVVNRNEAWYGSEIGVTSWNSDAWMFISIPQEFLSSVDNTGANAWLASLPDNYIVTWKMNTPVTIPLTAEQVGQITALKGQNTIWVDDSDDISVTAYGTEVE